MLMTWRIGGEELPINLSMSTLFEAAESVDTDITGLVEILQDTRRMGRLLKVLSNIGTIALNDGAERTGSSRRFTRWEVDDAISKDMTIVNELIDRVMQSVSAPEVFPTPSGPTAKKKAQRKG